MGVCTNLTKLKKFRKFCILFSLRIVLLVEGYSFFAGNMRNRGEMRRKNIPLIARIVHDGFGNKLKTEAFMNDIFGV